MRPGDELMVVDCLLPGQVRQLGQMKSFLTPRRPIKTTASDCEIRGGEYVAYDRASYGSALKIWLPQAESGDAEAQTNVGEIFEKGLGVPPDYEAAAVWYRRAAEQGLSRAAINLGNLYERGLGVPQDAIQALNWYRRASGLQDAVIMDQGTLNQTREEVASMREEVQRSRAEVEELRGQLQQARAELDKTRRQLQQREREARDQRAKLEQSRAGLEVRFRSARSQGDTDAAERLQRELEARDRELAARDSELAGLRSEIARVAAEAARRDEQIAELEVEKGRTAEALKAQVARTERDAEFLRAQLDEARVRLEEQRQRLRQQSGASQALANESVDNRQQASELEGRLDETRGQLTAVMNRLEGTSQALDTERRQVEALRAELERERNAASRDDSRVQALETRLAERARVADTQQAELAELRRQFDVVQAQSDRYRDRLVALIRERDQARAAAAAVTRESKPAGPAEPPRIEMLDPQILATREAAPEVVLRSATPTRDVVGKVVSSIDVVSLTVNDLRSSANDAGVFRASVPVTGDRTPVTVVAVDSQGNRATLTFDLVQAQPAAPRLSADADRAPEPPPTPAEAGIDLGRYHALVIGSDDYQTLPRLRTAVADAREVESLLRTRYGFNTTLVLNATRYQILSALNDLRETLTEDDNLLIYYAGHGELDRKNLRGHRRLDGAGGRGGGQHGQLDLQRRHHRPAQRDEREADPGGCRLLLLGCADALGARAAARRHEPGRQGTLDAGHGQEALAHGAHLRRRAAGAGQRRWQALGVRQGLHRGAEAERLGARGWSPVQRGRDPRAPCHGQPGLRPAARVRAAQVRRPRGWRLLLRPADLSPARAARP